MEKSENEKDSRRIHVQTQENASLFRGPSNLGRISPSARPGVAQDKHQTTEGSAALRSRNFLLPIDRPRNPTNHYPADRSNPILTRQATTATKEFCPLPPASAPPRLLVPTLRCGRLTLMLDRSPARPRSPRQSISLPICLRM